MPLSIFISKAIKEALYMNLGIRIREAQCINLGISNAFDYLNFTNYC